MIQIELPRYTKRELFPPQADFSAIEWWLSIFRHSDQYTEQKIGDLKLKGIIIPQTMLKNLDRLSYHKWNPEEQRLYQVQIEDREEFALSYAIERKEGREEGRAEGARESSIKAAKILLSSGIDIKIIAASTELTIPELTALQNPAAEEDICSEKTDLAKSMLDRAV